MLGVVTKQPTGGCGHQQDQPSAGPLKSTPMFASRLATWRSCWKLQVKTQRLSMSGLKPNMASARYRALEVS